MKSNIKIALAVAGLAGASGLTYAFTIGLFDEPPVLAQLPIGIAAPDFRAADLNGRPVSLSNLTGNTVVLEWNNPDCPTVKEHYEGGLMQKTQAAAAADGVVWLTVNSSAPWKQGHMDGAEAKAYLAAQRAQPAAYLLDPEGLVGRSYGAKATPHMFIINKAGVLVYQGAVRDPTAGASQSMEGARNHILAALGELKAGKPVSMATSRPYGCSVKYKA